MFQPAGDNGNANKSNSGITLSTPIRWRKKKKNSSWLMTSIRGMWNKRTYRLLLVGMKAADLHTSMTQQFYFCPVFQRSAQGCPLGIICNTRKVETNPSVHPEWNGLVNCVVFKRMKLTAGKMSLLRVTCMKMDRSQNHNVE